MTTKIYVFVRDNQVVGVWHSLQRARRWCPSCDMHRGDKIFELLVTPGISKPNFGLISEHRFDGSRWYCAARTSLL